MTEQGVIHDDRITHYEYTKFGPDIVSMRDDYLKWITKYREMGCIVCYQDETWVFKNISPRNVWKDPQGNYTDDQPKKPSGSGERSILSNVCY